MSTALLRAEFARNFSERAELGASVAVWQNGHELLSLGGGFQDRAHTVPWTAATPVLFWSATKGLASACVLHACEREGLPLDKPVSAVWPEFAQAGKEAVTIAEVLAHRAGLVATSPPAPATDHSAVAAALARQAPYWTLGEAHGYHPRTYGYLVDELVRRIAGVTLREYWEQNFARPLELELWIGMPREETGRVATVYPARNAPPKGDPFYVAFLTANSLTARSFASPAGLYSVASMNQPDARAGSYPGFGGIGTARSLAKFYGMLANDGTLDGRRYFAPATLAQMRTTLIQGPDQILLMETAFSAGFMKDPVDPAGHKIRQLFGPSLSAFGQPGAGGSHAFADPEQRLAFAYVMNQMEPGVLPNEKALCLVDAAYAP